MWNVQVYFGRNLLASPSFENGYAKMLWPLMSGLLHLVQRGEDWAGP